MAPKSRRDLITSRRRREDEGEDEGSVIVDDSHSEASIPTDAEDGDADASDVSETDEPASSVARVSKTHASNTKEGAKSGKGERASTTAGPGEQTAGIAFVPMADTEAMMNGLRVSDAAADVAEVNFEALGQEETAPSLGGDAAGAILQSAGNRQETFAERKRREHEDFKKRMEANPAIVPKKGAFFGHDDRMGPNGVGPFGRGRGRGRGANVGGPFSPAKYVILLQISGRIYANPSTVEKHALPKPRALLGRMTSTNPLPITRPKLLLHFLNSRQRWLLLYIQHNLPSQELLRHQRLPYAPSRART